MSMLCWVGKHIKRHIISANHHRLIAENDRKYITVIIITTTIPTTINIAVGLIIRFR